MSTVDGFNEVLNAMNDEFMKAPEQGQIVYPDPADYLVKINDVRASMIKDKAGRSAPAWFLDVEVVEGMFKGDVFPVIYKSHMEFQQGLTKGAARILRGGTPVGSIQEASTTLLESKGKLVIIRVRPPTKAGFTNVDLIGVPDVEESA